MLLDIFMYTHIDIYHFCFLILEAFCQISCFQVHQIQKQKKKNHFYRPQASDPGEKRNETKLS